MQITRDLVSFWNRGYHEVKKDLKGRYPKHYWPEDPYTAEPTPASPAASAFSMIMRMHIAGIDSSRIAARRINTEPTIR